MVESFMPYTYDLPREQIAQRPVHPPESARMLVVDRRSGEITHSTFAHIGTFLRAEDLLVFNETKVIPARLFGHVEEQPESGIEVLLVEQLGASRWLCLGRPLKRVKGGGTVIFGGVLRGTVVPSEHVDRVVLEFSSVDGISPIPELLHHCGTMPIPPYIRAGHGDEQDVLDYQSIFARHEGSIAAPTASLHFSPDLMSTLTGQVGCTLATVTLHVGTASFQPILIDGALRPPSEERYEVPEATLEAARLARSRGHRVVAVGTTVTRALETVGARGELQGGRTGLFIQPGFEFKLVDVLVTNFHQPGTTHLLLVEALLGRALVEQCYQEALREGYRFLSYGDGMMIV